MNDIYEDMISRQAVLDLCDMNTKYKIPYEYYENKKTWVKGWDDGRIINMTKLMQLPSVKPQKTLQEKLEKIKAEFEKEDMYYLLDQEVAIHIIDKYIKEENKDDNAES